MLRRGQRAFPAGQADAAARGGGPGLGGPGGASAGGTRRRADADGGPEVVFMVFDISVMFYT